MIKIIPIALLFILMLIDFTPAKWYSRARQEKWVADSLKRIDSLHIADSLRLADSLTVARYQASDSMLVKQKMQEAAELKNTPAMPDTGIVPIPGEVDITSGRTIVIDPKNPYAKTIDSMQKVIDSLNNYVHDCDSRLKEMKKFPISEKKRYIHFLLQNKLKDTAAIVMYCNSIYEIYKVKQDMLFAIKNSQDPNTKTFIQSHIEEHRKKMADLSNFILAVTPKVQFLPQRDLPKKITEQ
jgi:hypothetical protein